MKSNLDGAVRSYISWKETGGSAPTDRISVKEAAVNIKLHQQKKVDEVLKGIIKPQVEVPVAVSAGEAVGKALGGLTNGLINASKAFVREVGKASKTYAHTVNLCVDDSDEVAKRISNIMENKLTETVEFRGETYTFVNGEMKEGK